MVPVIYYNEVMNEELILKRISRASAWALLASVIVLLVSGWGITQTGVIYDISFGFIDRRISNAIHRSTNMPLAIFFLTHVMINIRLKISETRPSWVWAANVVLIIIGIAILGIVAYLEYFRLGG
jgi:hypothetical protein